MQSFPPRFINLLPLYLVIFFGFVGFSLMITIFTPLLLSVDGGMLPATMPTATRAGILGVLLALYPFGQFLGSPVIGAFSDHYGRRNILILSLIVTTFFYGVMTLALMQKNLSLLMIGSFCAGLSEANVAIAQSAIADLTDEANRTRLFGYVYMSASAAFILGPLAGGTLADASMLPWFNASTPFWVVFGLLVFVTCWIFFVFKETEHEKAQGKIDYFSAFTSLASIITDKHLRYYYFLNFLFYLSVYGFFRCYPMYLVDEFHLSVGPVSHLIAWVAVPIVVGNLWLTGFLSKHFSAKKMCLVSGLCTGIFMMIVVWPSNPNALWLTLFLTALALAICLPSCASLLSVAAGAHEQGKVMGNNQSLQALSQAVSGVLGGLIAMIAVKLSLVVLAVFAILGAFFLLK